MPTTPPNVVLIMTDQQRADHSAREGFPLDTTPALDRLARAGVWFDHAYTPIPICGPARISVLTGRYASAHGVRENHGLRQARYEQDIFETLRAHGYATALVGKNHAHLLPETLDHASLYMHNGGLGPDRTDEERAFDNWLKALRHRVSEEPTPFPVECQAPYRIVSQAQSWIDAVSDRPFFLWLSFPEPHNPYQVPEPYFSMFPPETLPPLQTAPDAYREKGFTWRYLRRIGEAAQPGYGKVIPRARSNYLGMLRLIDDQIARFVDHLARTGRLENTLLIFMADHGDYVGEYGLMRKGAELPEVLIRVPLSITGPGIVGRDLPHPAFVSLVDVFPTICEALGVTPPAGVQGRSLWPLLTDRPYPPEEFTSAYAELGIGGLHYTEADIVDEQPGLAPDRGSFDELNAVTQSGVLRAVRRGDWKLVLDMEGAGQLYDLAHDPFELTNLYRDDRYVEQRASLLAELAAWMMRVQDPLPIPPDGYRRKTDPRNYHASARPVPVDHA